MLNEQIWPKKHRYLSQILRAQILRDIHFLKSFQYFLYKIAYIKFYSLATIEIIEQVDHNLLGYYVIGFWGCTYLNFWAATDFNIPSLTDCT